MKASLLSNAGFEIVGNSFIKVIKAENMPYFKEHIIDNDVVFGCDSVEVKVSLLKEEVELVTVRGYHEGPYSLKDGEAFQVLREAGVNFVE